jgi:apolipoprotein N-acyltransferase
MRPHEGDRGAPDRGVMGRAKQSLIRGAIVGAALHFAVFLLVAIVTAFMASRPVAQWQLSWLYMERIDWPISTLLRWGWPREPVSWLPYQFSHPRWFVVPCLVFGILGTSWYALLGGIIGVVIAEARERRRRHSLRGTMRRPPDGLAVDAYSADQQAGWESRANTGHEAGRGAGRARLIG